MNKQMTEKQQQLQEKSSRETKDKVVKTMRAPDNSVGSTPSIENNFNSHEPVQPCGWANDTLSDDQAMDKCVNLKSFTS